MKYTTLAILAGFLLDQLFGDPYWLPHPIRAIGWLISKGETWIRGILPKTPMGEKTGGFFLVALVLGVTGILASGILYLTVHIHPLAGLVVESMMCYQLLAAKSLKTESMKVYHAFEKQDTEGARYAVSMIVGRDTKPLSPQGIMKAAVETVAENTSDGVIAPLFFMAIGGAPLAFLYKAVNTMDSMVGYKNEKYYYFGFAAAKLDDLVNFIPARLSAFVMIAAAFLTGLDGKNAWRIFWRDRFNHKSPNSAQTEAVCAGALRVQLAGNAYYFGKLYEKPTIGDDLRPVENKDIRLANRLMMGTAWLSLVLLLAVRLLLLYTDRHFLN